MADFFLRVRQIRVVRDAAPSGGKEKHKTASRTAGLSAIQLHLHSSARVVKEVAAGSAFYDTLPREEKRKVNTAFLHYNNYYYV